MNYYTETIPQTLAEQLIFEKGMTASPVEGFIEGCDNLTIVDWKTPTYAEVFDWLMEKGTMTSIYPFITEIGMIAYKLIIKTVRNNKVTTHCTNVYPTWHEAAEHAIDKALALI